MLSEAIGAVDSLTCLARRSLGADFTHLPSAKFPLLVLILGYDAVPGFIYVLFIAH